MLTRSVVDENVQAAKIARRVVDKLAAKSFVANVAGERRRIDVGFAHQVHDLLRVRFLFWQIIDRNVRAFAREGNGGGAADAAVAAGDQRLAAKQAA